MDTTKQDNPTGPNGHAEIGPTNTNAINAAATPAVGTDVAGTPAEKQVLDHTDPNVAGQNVDALDHVAGQNADPEANAAAHREAMNRADAEDDQPSD